MWFKRIFPAWLWKMLGNTVTYIKWQWVFPMRYREPFAFLKEMDPPPTEILWTDYEVHFQGKIKRISKYLSLHGKTILALGCGHGEELKDWLKMGVSTCIGADIHLSKMWASFRDQAELRFVQTDGSRLAFKENIFDMVVSDAVFEHLLNIPEVLSEIKRVLKPDGFCWISAGPLYYSSGHHSVGEYTHLTMSPETFLKDLLEKEKENPDNLILWEKGMVNRHILKEYLTFFKNGFEIVYFGYIFDWRGLVFRKKHSDVWSNLARQYSERDLLSKSFMILLKKCK